jgi:hypothetical protein
MELYFRELKIRGKQPIRNKTDTLSNLQASLNKKSTLKHSHGFSQNSQDTLNSLYGSEN